MKYLCLVYEESTRLDALSKRDVEHRRGEVRAVLADLTLSGQHLVSTAEIPAQATTTVRVRNGRMVVTDGWVNQGKEHITGFFVIDARDLNEALRLAARMPSARDGSIEVVPVPELLLASGLIGQAMAGSHTEP